MKAILILFCAVFTGSIVDALQCFPAVLLEPLGDSLCATSEEVIAEIVSNIALDAFRSALLLYTRV